MKIKYLFFIIFLLSTIPVFAKVANVNLQQMLKRSDVVVEGKVIEKQDVSIENQGFKLNNFSKFYIEKIYFGKVKTGQVIDIYGGSEFYADTSHWQKDKQYLLFLKKLKKIKNGFVDARMGRGTYTIEEKNGKKMIYTGISGREEWYEYEKFSKDIKELLK